MTNGVGIVAGDREIELARDGTTHVDPAVSFRVEVAAAIVDGRLSLRDDQDAMVPSTGTTEVASSWTHYRLTPDAPLRPGTSYTLRLDGAVTHDARDAAGRAYRPVAFSIRTTGNRPPSATKRRPRGR